MAKSKGNRIRAPRARRPGGSKPCELRPSPQGGFVGRVVCMFGITGSRIHFNLCHTAFKEIFFERKYRCRLPALSPSSSAFWQCSSALLRLRDRSG